MCPPRHPPLGCWAGYDGFSPGNFDSVDKLAAFVARKLSSVAV